ncbi:hypothetical protein MMC25_003250 [Agyrium rufum]|nr:hypothetical protein [Agyrium rufum]
MALRVWRSQQACQFNRRKWRAISRRSIATKSAFFQVSEEVQDALRLKKPVVALETTIYTHGFPYPDNIALSSRLESIVRQNGAVPATIGVLNGIAKVGFAAEELIELLGSSGSPTTVKLSRRDLGYICGTGIHGTKLNGGTTIAGTMVLAHLAGIKVFATGGLGGVHRGGETSMDISADLTELGRTPVALISSGCKSFLDIPRTLEYLETQGVGVSTFADGRTGPVDFPAFWTRDSGVRSPQVTKNEEEAAAIIYAQVNFPLNSGLLLANPISPEHSISKEVMDSVMSQAVKEANAQGVTGGDNTPFVLHRIRELTQGATVTANQALVEDNVRRGARVASELAKLEMRQTSNTPRGTSSASRNPLKYTNTKQQQRTFHHSATLSSSKREYLEDMQRTTQSEANNLEVIVAGSVALDTSCDYISPAISHFSEENTKPRPKTSNPARITQSVGGVGANLATAIHYLGVNVRLCAMAGDDPPGKRIIGSFKKLEMETTGILPSKHWNTAQYVAVNDANGDLHVAMADMDIMTIKDKEPADFMNNGPGHNAKKLMAGPKWLIVDGNWNPDMITRWIQYGRELGARVAFEPVSQAKSTRIFSSMDRTAEPQVKTPEWPLVDVAAPNEHELEQMSAYLGPVHPAARGLKRPTIHLASEAGEECMPVEISSHFGFGKTQTSIDSRGNDPSSSVRPEALVRLRGSSDFQLHLARYTSLSAPILRHIPTLLVKLGENGVILISLILPESQSLLSHRMRSESQYQLPNEDFTALKTRMLWREDATGLYIRHFPAACVIPTKEIVSVNGVGDTFFGMIIAGFAQEEPLALDELIPVAQKGAIKTLKSPKSVSEEIAEFIDELGIKVKTVEAADMKDP